MTYLKQGEKEVFLELGLRWVQVVLAGFVVDLVFGVVKEVMACVVYKTHYLIRCLMKHLAASDNQLAKVAVKPSHFVKYIFDVGKNYDDVCKDLDEGTHTEEDIQALKGFHKHKHDKRDIHKLHFPIIDDEEVEEVEEEHNVMDEQCH